MHYLAVASLLLAGVYANVHTYPVKSRNLDAALKVDYFETEPPENYAPFRLSENYAIRDVLEDFHPVHGFECADGSGFILSGNAYTGFAGTGFVLKLSSTGKYVWGWQTNCPNDNAVTAAVEMSDGSILAVGFRTELQSNGSGVATRFVSKLTSAGVHESTFTAFGDSVGSHGAWEMIEMTSDSIILSGLHKKTTIAHVNGTGMAFKSYGNTLGGQAVVMKIPLSQLPEPVPAVSFTKEWPDCSTAKACRALSDGKTACLLHSKEEFAGGSPATIAMLDSNGAAVWGPTSYPGFEGTDLQIATDGNLAMSGHGPADGGGSVNGPSYTTAAPGGRRLGGSTTVIYGTLMKVQASDGTLMFKAQAAAGGTPAIIYNECWGVTAMSDGGFVLACGTGIENCAEMTGQTLIDCQAGTGDPRPGAVKRSPAIWQSLLAKFDANGNFLWQRVDSYRHSCNPGITDPTFEGGSSATEWSVQTRDGGLAAIIDDQIGVGILKLSANGLTQPSCAPRICTDDDAAHAAAGLGEFCADSVEVCIDSELVRRHCPMSCCEPFCTNTGVAPWGRRLCAAPNSEIMLFESAMPMSWTSLTSSEQEAIQAAKDGSLTPGSATYTTLGSFGTAMSEQVISNIVQVLTGINADDLLGMCVYLLGDSRKQDLRGLDNSCNTNYDSSPGTTLATLPVGDGLGLQGSVNRQFLLLVLTPEQSAIDMNDSRTNAQLMEEFLALLARDFAFSYTGAESTSKCTPFKYHGSFDRVEPTTPSRFTAPVTGDTSGDDGDAGGGYALSLGSAWGLAAIARIAMV